MAVGPRRVLFLCTGNSARSLLAEAILRHRAGPAVEVSSAGTHPRGVHPLTLRVLAEAGIDTSGLRSKSVTEVLDQPFDHVITVCDRARDECPVFPGARQMRHWSEEDPAAVEGDEAARLDAFRRTERSLAARIDTFVRQEFGEGRAGPIATGG